LRGSNLARGDSGLQLGSSDPYLAMVTWPSDCLKAGFTHNTALPKQPAQQQQYHSSSMNDVFASSFCISKSQKNGNRGHNDNRNGGGSGDSSLTKIHMHMQHCQLCGENLVGSFGHTVVSSIDYSILRCESCASNRVISSSGGVGSSSSSSGGEAKVEVHTSVQPQTLNPVWPDEVTLVLHVPNPLFLGVAKREKINKKKKKEATSGAIDRTTSEKFVTLRKHQRNSSSTNSDAASITSTPSEPSTSTSTSVVEKVRAVRAAYTGWSTRATAGSDTITGSTTTSNAAKSSNSRHRGRSLSGTTISSSSSSTGGATNKKVATSSFALDDDDADVGGGGGTIGPTVDGASTAKPPPSSSSRLVSSGRLVLLVVDHDSIGTDDPLGSVTLSLDEILQAAKVAASSSSSSSPSSPPPPVNIPSVSAPPSSPLKVNMSSELSPAATSPLAVSTNGSPHDSRSSSWSGLGNNRRTAKFHGKGAQKKNRSIGDCDERRERGRRQRVYGGRTGHGGGGVDDDEGDGNSEQGIDYLEVFRDREFNFNREALLLGKAEGAVSGTIRASLAVPVSSGTMPYTAAASSSINFLSNSN
jgi:hypothetical protein